MNLDHELINLLIEKRDVHTFSTAPVTSDMIKDGIAKNVFSYIDKHIRTYGVFPSNEVILKETGYSPYKPQGDLSYVLKEISHRIAHENIISSISRLKENLLRKDYDEIKENWKKWSEEVYSFLPHEKGSRDIFEKNHGVIEDYQKAKRKEYGILTPWPSLNELCLGFQGGDYVLIGGRSGLGKTFLSMFMLNRMFQDNHKVLYCSPEMAAKAIVKRFASAYLGLSYKKIRHGLLHEGAEKRYFDFINDFDRINRDRIHILTDSFIMDIDNLAREVDILEPELVFIDGVYLMRAKGMRNRFDQAAYIADTIKQMAKRFNVPIICTTQLNRDAINLKVSELHQGHFVLSDAFSWNADMGLILARDKIHRENKQLVMKPVKTREAFMDRNIILNWDFDNQNFSEYNLDQDSIKNKKVKETIIKQIDQAQFADDDLPF